jgi:hypothetical protein
MKEWLVSVTQDEELQLFVLPFLHRVGINVEFQHDNARRNTSHASWDFLTQNNMRILPRSPKSPDRICIEHLWGVLRSWMRDRDVVLRKMMPYSRLSKKSGAQAPDRDAADYFQ